MQIQRYSNASELARDFLVPLLQRELLDKEWFSASHAVKVYGLTDHNSNNKTTPWGIVERLGANQVLETIESGADRVQNLSTGNPHFAESFFLHQRTAMSRGYAPTILGTGKMQFVTSQGVDLTQNTEPAEVETSQPEPWQADYSHDFGNEGFSVEPPRGEVIIFDADEQIQDITLRLLETIKEIHIGSINDEELRESTIAFVRILPPAYKAAMLRIAHTEFADNSRHIEALDKLFGVTTEGIIKYAESESQRINSELSELHVNPSLDRAEELSQDYLDLACLIAETIDYSKHSGERERLLKALILPIENGMFLNYSNKDYAQGMKGVLELWARVSGDDEMVNDRVDSPIIFSAAPGRIMTAFVAIVSSLDSTEQQDVLRTLIARSSTPDVQFDDFKLTTGGWGVIVCSTPYETDPKRLLEFNTRTVTLGILNATAPYLKDKALTLETRATFLGKEMELLLSGDIDKVSQSAYAIWLLGNKLPAKPTYFDRHALRWNDTSKRALEKISNILEFYETVNDLSSLGYQFNGVNAEAWQTRCKFALAPFAPFLETFVLKRQLEGRGILPLVEKILLDEDFTQGAKKVRKALGGEDDDLTYAIESLCRNLNGSVTPTDFGYDGKTEFTVDGQSLTTKMLQSMGSIPPQEDTSFYKRSFHFKVSKQLNALERAHIDNEVIVANLVLAAVDKDTGKHYFSTPKHPYYDKTKAEIWFSIEGLPKGDYTLKFIPLKEAVNKKLGLN